MESASRLAMAGQQRPQQLGVAQEAVPDGRQRRQHGEARLAGLPRALKWTPGLFELLCAHDYVFLKLSVT